MGRLKDLLVAWNDDDDEDNFSKAVKHPNEYWMTKKGYVRIEDMDFQHLENVVNLVSNGMEIPPHMQPSFENVMLTYLRKQAEINDVHKDIL